MYKRTFLLLIPLAFVINARSQSFFSTSTYENAPQGVGANNIFGWGENFDRTVDVRPNPHPWMGTLNINYHTGLTFSAHSYYGGIRFYNQGYPNAYDVATGAKMVMSIMNGNVGIGEADPRSLLTLSSDNISDVLINRSPAKYARVVFATGGVKKWYVGMDNDVTPNSDMFVIESPYTTHFSIDPAGNVGIGNTDTRGYKLAVAGSAIATSMTVQLKSQWPDYVFGPSYELPSLKDISNYVRSNKHLPELPSAKEIEAKGVDVGEILKLQTKKIEELTLYLIQKDRQLEAQQKKALEQDRRFKRLESRLRSLERSER